MISSHWNFLFFVLSKSPNQMCDRLPLRIYQSAPPPAPHLWLYLLGQCQMGGNNFCLHFSESYLNLALFYRVSKKRIPFERPLLPEYQSSYLKPALFYCQNIALDSVIYAIIAGHSFPWIWEIFCSTKSCQDEWE